MDPLPDLLTVAVSGIAGGSLGEAGSQLWRSLVDLVDRTIGARAVDSDPPRPLPPAPPSPDEVAHVVRQLLALAATDPDFRDDLQCWGQLAQREGAVLNNITGDVTGKVVQARDIGNLSL